MRLLGDLSTTGLVITRAKWQIDPSGRYALGMAVNFEHRSPFADDTVALGIVDMADGDAWSEFGRTRAWCWQQGCMLQWVPNSDTEVIFNDREGDAFVSRIYNVKTGAVRTLPHAIYTVSPDGKTAIGADFRRINHMRPGYGYAGIPDPNRDVRAPDDVGVYSVDSGDGSVKACCCDCRGCCNSVSAWRYFRGAALILTICCLIRMGRGSFFCTAGDLARAVLIRG